MTSNRKHIKRRALGRARLLLTIGVVVLGPVAVARGQSDRSLMAQSLDRFDPQQENGLPHGLLDSSMFAIAPPEIRSYKKHDLVQIIVRESSRAESTQELDTGKKYRLDSKISAWPHMDLTDILQLQLMAGNTTDLPEVKVDMKKIFEGEGDYNREDDFTARLTAEILDVLPNGNLILEARTFIKTDEEEATLRVSGVCRPEDISPANSILSNLIHDLKIEKIHTGELKKTNEKGLFAKILDVLFAF